MAIRTTCILVVAGLLIVADCAFAQAPGQLRILLHVTDATSGVTYPAARRALTITREADATIYRVETAADGTASIALPPGTYVVESVDPVPFQGRHYRWRATVAVASGASLVLELTDRNAQSTPIPSADRGPFLAPFAQYGAPQRLAAGATVLFPIGRTTGGEGGLAARGLQFQAGAGQGGWRVAAGAGSAGLPVWWGDILVSATRTTAATRGASKDATYIGVEAGLALILPLDAWVHLPFGVLFKPSFGYARRIDGPAGGDRNMYTWSAGAHLVGLGF